MERKSNIFLILPLVSHQPALTHDKLFTEMVDALTAAGNALHLALEEYISVCSTIPSCYVHADQVSGGRRMFSARVAEELRMFAFYETKLKQAKMTLSMGRNYCATIVPINALPDEILARIFHMVLCSQPCTWKNYVHDSEVLNFPKYPDLLSHVCSRWRWIAISSCTLWSHIDLAPCDSLGKGLLDRAGTLAERAGGAPLYIHVFCLDVVIDFEETKSEFEEFLYSIGTHIKSLELNVDEPPDPEDSDTEDSDAGIPDEREEERDVYILESCLGSCIPGALTQLIIKDNARQTSSHIESALARREPTFSLLLDLPREFLEDLWYPITVLRLGQGLYPLWTSKAYHNLVELHLISGYDPNVPISEAQLITILKSSPMLRVLRLDLVITDQARVDVPVSPVHLGELELLSLSSRDLTQQLGSFLRWIAPGSLPLRLSITNRFHAERLLSHPGFKKFFECSNIISLRLAIVSVTCQDVAELLDLLPHLRTLVLDGCSCLDEPRTAKLHSDEHRALASSARLDNLYLLNYRGNIENIQWVKGYPIQKLTIWSCWFLSRGRSYLHVLDDTKVIRQRLSGICPVVELIDSTKPDPVGWD